MPAMWARISRPDVLIYLDVDYETAKARRPHINWGPERLQEQGKRLAHARQYCDLYIDTSTLTAAEVQSHAFAFLERTARQRRE